LRVVEQTVTKDDPDNKARACYGVLFPATNDVWLRFLDGRPVSAVTTSFLAWCCEGAAAQGKTALLLVWDNASWHRSQEVRAWIRVHNRQVKATGAGVRLPICPLPVKSPWLNPIEPKWLHTKRRVIEPNRLLSAQELAERVCDALGCTYHDHIPIRPHPYSRKGVCWPFGISVRVERHFALASGSDTLRERGSNGCRALVAGTR